ncbi:hypothetical protein HPB51_028921 [Rhipicephalus microplus]|uniref:Tick transposon n=1 Tax=Rhipicephalus microplus TaxID=6941 RepID=A0A9J6CVL3_RHIMP|nr:hypothetical protein HPB51_028921 [Rhipicephalus microplus]
MGAHNTAEELIKAHLSNQRIRLSHTEHGRAVLRKIGWQIEPVLTKAVFFEKLEDNNSNESPSPEHDAGQGRLRRTARAEAIARKSEENPRVMYADASLRKHSYRAVVVVTSIERLIVSASLRTKDPDSRGSGRGPRTPTAERGRGGHRLKDRLWKLPQGGNLIRGTSHSIQVQASRKSRTPRVGPGALRRKQATLLPNTIPEKCQSGPSMSWKSYHTRLPAFETYTDVPRGKVQTTRTTPRPDQETTDDIASSTGAIA